MPLPAEWKPLTPLERAEIAYWRSVPLAYEDPLPEEAPDETWTPAEADGA